MAKDTVVPHRPKPPKENPLSSKHRIGRPRQYTREEFEQTLREREKRRRKEDEEE